MNKHTPLDDMITESSVKGKDGKTRTVLYVVVVLWLLTLGSLIFVLTKAYFDKKDEVQSLQTQIAIACDRGTFGPPDFSVEDEKELCEDAEKGDDAPVIIEGEEGPQGPPGLDGIDGLDGTDGSRGPMGRPGQAGEDGEGSTGPEGPAGEPGESVQGETGSTGPAGPPGPQGEKGDPGTNGVDGQNGQDAVPFTFSFTIDGLIPQTYICTITQADSNVVCQEQE